MPISILGSDFSHNQTNSSNLKLWRIRAGDKGANFLLAGRDDDSPRGTANFIYPNSLSRHPQQSAVHELPPIHGSGFDFISVADRANGGYVAAIGLGSVVGFEVQFVGSAGTVERVLDFSILTGEVLLSPKIIWLDNGNYLITYTQVTPGPTDILDSDVYGQIIDENGELVGDRFVVNGEVENFSAARDLVQAGNGFAQVYADITTTGDATEVALRVRYLDANGSPSGPDVQIAPPSTEAKVIKAVSLGNGGIAVFWAETNEINSGEVAVTWAVRASFLDAQGTVTASTTVLLLTITFRHSMCRPSTCAMAALHSSFLLGLLRSGPTAIPCRGRLSRM